MLGLDGKVVLITGAGRGIGRSTALAMAKAGAAAVVVNFKEHQSAAQSTCAEVESAGAQAVPAQADVTRREEVYRMVMEAIKQFGRIDILVNNAGISRSNPLEKISEEDWDAVMDTNLKGLFNCCQLVAPEMVRQRWGRIINISSIAGRRGSLFGDVHYSAAKAGVIGFSMTLARRLAPFEVTVNTVAPGIVVTDLLAESLDREHLTVALRNIPLGRAAEPEDVASACLFFASNLANYITGTTLDVNGGAFMG